MPHCLNCGNDFEGKYCPECGQKALTKRLSIGNIISGIIDVLFNRDSKTVRTCWELISRPGVVARDFILGHRGRYNAPMPLLVALVALYSIAVHFMPDAASPFSSFEINVSSTVTSETIDEGEEVDETLAVEPKETVVEKKITSIWDPDIFEYMEFDMIILLALQEILGNIIYHVVLSSFVCAIPYWLVFRRRMLLRQDGKLLSMNLAEHFFTLFYLSSISIMVALVTLPLNFLPGLTSPLNTILCIIPSLICIVMYRQILSLSWGRSIWLNIVASLLAVVLIALFFCILILPDMLGDEGTLFFDGISYSGS